PKSRKLTNLEESVIVQYILNLNSKGFLSRLYSIEDIANHLLTKRNTGYIGIY
ncbi:hypothetical protein OIDMADRAFT_138093, partial [Oidiodendron maius Zn]